MNHADLKAAFVAWMKDAGAGATVVYGASAAPQAALPFVTAVPLGLGGTSPDARQRFDPGSQVWKHTGTGLGTFQLGTQTGGPAVLPVAKSLGIRIYSTEEPLSVEFTWGDVTSGMELVEGMPNNLAEAFPGDAELALVTITPRGKNPGGYWVADDVYRYEAEHFGAEVELEVQEPQYLTLSVQAHAADELAALALAGELKLALEREVTRADLYAAGASVVDSGTIKSVGKLVDAGKKGIAVFEPRFLVKAQTSERVPYIAKVVITPTLQSPGRAPVEEAPFEVDVE